MTGMIRLAGKLRRVQLRRSAWLVPSCKALHATTTAQRYATSNAQLKADATEHASSRTSHTTSPVDGQQQWQKVWQGGIQEKLEHHENQGAHEAIQEVSSIKGEVSEKVSSIKKDHVQEPTQELAQEKTIENTNIAINSSSQSNAAQTKTGPQETINWFVEGMTEKEVEALKHDRNYVNYCEPQELSEYDEDPSQALPHVSDELIIWLTCVSIACRYSNVPLIVHGTCLTSFIFLVTTIYIVFFFDLGPQEHCFSEVGHLHLYDASRFDSWLIHSTPSSCDEEPTSISAAY